MELSLTKEQEETRSYISISASPRANDAQIIPAERAEGVQQVKKSKTNRFINKQARPINF